MCIVYVKKAERTAHVHSIRNTERTVLYIVYSALSTVGFSVC